MPSDDATQPVSVSNSQGIIAGDHGQITINHYDHFRASPTHLRRSFDALIADKLRNFTGRQFVFEAWDRFVATQPGGYFIVRGVPGVGKSAFLASLVNQRGYIHHFNIAAQNIRSTRAFLENICAQLIARYNLPHSELPSSAFEDGGFLAQCLGEAAERAENRPVVIAIDALDEADRLGLAPSANLLYLPYALPEGVYCLITARPLDDPHLHLDRVQTWDLEAGSSGNMQDIHAYIAACSEQAAMQARLEQWGIRPGQFIPALGRKSQGNFMYLHHVLPAIEAGRFTTGGLDELPEGLVGYYRQHWRQMQAGDAQGFESIYEPVVCILGVAQEPVSIRQVAAWTHMPAGQVRKALALWREFLDEHRAEQDCTYNIYHASFQDFLKSQVDLLRYDAMIAEYYLDLMGGAGGRPV